MAELQSDSDVGIGLQNDADVGLTAPASVPTAMPPAFKDRILRGDALTRALGPIAGFAKGAQEHFDTQTPFGMSDETVQLWREHGIFADPATGRPGLIPREDEAAVKAIAIAGDAVLRGIHAAIGGVGGAVEQTAKLADEAGIVGDLGDLSKHTGPGNRGLGREISAMLEYRLTSGDAVHARLEPIDTVDKVRSQKLGTTPTAADFSNAATNIHAMQRPPTIPTVDSTIDPIVERVRSLGTPMEIAQRYATDPEGTVTAINELIPQIKAAEREIKNRHGVKSKDISDLENAPLNQKEKDFLFYGKEPTDTEFWQDLRKQLQPVDSLDEAAQEIAYEFKRLPKNMDKLSTDDQLVMARLQVVFSEVGRLGGDLRTVLREAASKYGARFTDPEDAIFMVQDAAEKLRGMMPAPMAAEPLAITNLRNLWETAAFILPRPRTMPRAMRSSKAT